MTSPGYTVAQAATMLGRSPRWVRKLIDQGRLDVIPDTKPLRVTEASVLAERSRSKVEKPREDTDTFTMTEERLAQIIEQAVASAIERTVPLMIESRERVDARQVEDLENELHRVRAELSQAQAQLGQQNSPDEGISAINADSKKRRRWWRNS